MLRALSFVALVALLGAAGAADEEVAPPPSEPKLQAYAFGWSWDRGLHYGIDVPDPFQTWEQGVLQWHPLLRGDIGIRLGIDAVGMWQHGGWVDLDDDIGVRRACRPHQRDKRDERENAQQRMLSRTASTPGPC